MSGKAPSPVPIATILCRIAAAKAAHEAAKAAHAANPAGPAPAAWWAGVFRIGFNNPRAGNNSTTFFSYFMTNEDGTETDISSVMVKDEVNGINIFAPSLEENQRFFAEKIARSKDRPFALKPRTEAGSTRAPAAAFAEFPEQYGDEVDTTRPRSKLFQLREALGELYAAEMESRIEAGRELVKAANEGRPLEQVIAGPLRPLHFIVDKTMHGKVLPKYPSIPTMKVNGYAVYICAPSLTMFNAVNRLVDGKVRTNPLSYVKLNTLKAGQAANAQTTRFLDASKPIMVQAADGSSRVGGYEPLLVDGSAVTDDNVHRAFNIGYRVDGTVAIGPNFSTMGIADSASLRVVVVSPPAARAAEDVGALIAAMRGDEEVPV